MKIVILAISMGLILSADLTEAQTAENFLPRCQQLAQDYSKKPETLTADRLKQLQYCINQSLAKRETTDPPAMLKGTIIEPLSPSSGSSMPTSPDLQRKGKN